jgi:alkanesulfonate monooxygenase SsuD/methylene tetrahydromethanopterin reductase-like flavin-dependent oxidoreductase (luciferase family)
VHEVVVTSNRAAAAEEISKSVPEASADDIACTPFVLIGSHEQMADQLQAQAGQFGITSYVIREPAVPGLERVLALLPR